MVAPAQEVTAKFKVQSVIDAFDGAKTVTLYPDYADGRNKEWAVATPAGSIQMTIKNALAADMFQQGQAFTITFTPGD